jgi:hypothetical protein
MADKPDDNWTAPDCVPGDFLGVIADSRTTYLTQEDFARYNNLAVRITWTPEERAEIDQHLREWLDGQFGYDG